MILTLQVCTAEREREQRAQETQEGATNAHVEPGTYAVQPDQTTRGPGESAQLTSSYLLASSGCSSVVKDRHYTSYWPVQRTITTHHTS
jgi:hypothetical protein